MELENLKSIWNDINAAPNKNAHIDKKDISALLKGKTQNAFSKIKRSLFFEIGSLLVATIVFIGLILYEDDSLKNSLVIAILGLFFLSAVYYIAKYYQLQHINLQGNNLKDGLETLVSTLEKYLRLYFIGTILLTPISTLSGFFYGYTLQEESERPLSELPIEIWVAACITAILLTLLMFPFMRWYLHKLYGSYLQKLKHCLSELEEE